MKLLVTGGSGLIGSNVVREAVALGYDVRALLRPTSSAAAIEGIAAERFVGDVLDIGSLHVAAANCDAIIHTAAIFAYGGFTGAQLHDVAVIGTRNVIDAAAAAGVRRVVVTSSSVVCGSSTDPVPRDETCRADNGEKSPYVIAKIEQEGAAFAHGLERSVEVMACCPTLTIGGYDHRLSPSNAVIVMFLRDVLRLTYPGGCNIASVSDVARGHLLLLERGSSGLRYIVGGENLTWTDLHRRIAALCGVSGPYFATGRTGAYLAAAANEMIGLVARRAPLTTRVQARMVGRYYWYSHARAAALGYAPRSGAQALAEAIAWLVTSPHISRELRATLTLSRDVYRARLT
ncbi:MAG TPA: NAD-dependent epimerase/dehydratase family protein [Thermoanaerobaculia bacterium]|jgi:dihydroflavonol-4-reductase